MPLMEYYCKVGDLTSILRLYRQTQDAPGVHWDVESYTILLSSMARFGYFFGENDMETKTNDDINTYGPELFDMLVSNMANDILEITEATLEELTEAFQNAMNNKRSFPSTVIIDKVSIPTNGV